MSRSRQPHSEGWCCIDCLMLFANGETPADWPRENSGWPDYIPDARTNEERTEAWLAAIDAKHAGRTSTLGTLDHADDCPNMARPACKSYRRRHHLRTFDTDRGMARQWTGCADCSCETLEFSSRSCDTCGSRYAGSRHAVTFWYEESN